MSCLHDFTTCVLLLKQKMKELNIAAEHERIKIEAKYQKEMVNINAKTEFIKRWKDETAEEREKQLDFSMKDWKMKQCNDRNKTGSVRAIHNPFEIGVKTL
jgi:hypothetical protein